LWLVRVFLHHLHVVHRDVAGAGVFGPDLHVQGFGCGAFSFRLCRGDQRKPTTSLRGPGHAIRWKSPQRLRVHTVPGEKCRKQCRKQCQTFSRGRYGPQMGGKRMETSLNIIQHYPTLSNITQHHPTSSNIIQHHPTSSNIIQHHPTLSNNETQISYTE
jgi:hypothetical protein